jgi:hypothetical protein
MQNASGISSLIWTWLRACQEVVNLRDDKVTIANNLHVFPLSDRDGETLFPSTERDTCNDAKAAPF